MTQATLVMFAVFVAMALVITYWASGRSASRRGFYTAHREITGIQTGWAIAGDYMSATSFLGITGLIAFYGYDGFMYAIGWLVAYLTVLFLLAEPLRNTGRYTVADVIAFRLRGRGVRAIAACTTLIITLFYMVAQMVGAGSLINLLIQRISETYAIIVVGLLMVIYVLFGGMLATTWVQIIKAGLLLASSIVLSVAVLAHFHFSLFALRDAAMAAPAGGHTIDLLKTGLLFSGRFGGIEVFSLSLALVLGTAGLPHILMRFFTVPTANAARISVGWAMALIGVFYFLTTIMGLGAGTIVGQHDIGKHLRDTQAIRYIVRHPEDAARLNPELARNGYIVPQKNTNLAAPLLADSVGGPLLTAFVAAAAFATILAVVAGLTIAAASAFAHDIWYSLIRTEEGSDREHIFVARGTAIVIGFIAIACSVGLRTVNVAFLVGLAFSVAASTNAPALILALTWRRFSRTGAICGMLAGLISSLALIAASPDVMGERAIFPLHNPGIVSIPLGFLAAFVGTLLARDPESEAVFNQLQVRANTGIGAEV
ncbi:MAG TPA: cation acetate symporter [Candidatus Acidoferrales bacterium]|nr:cation acetate symporter [Candidatus Acidoferrales bacterium]